MSGTPFQRLVELLSGLFGDADELGRHLRYADLDAIYQLIPSQASLAVAAFTAADAMRRHDTIEPFLSYLLEQPEFARRRDDVLDAAQALGLSLGGEARRRLLQAILKASEERQILAGLRNPAISMADVYVPRLLCELDQPEFTGKSLPAWVQALAPGRGVLVLGEPGAGKTELFLHTAAALARAALADAAAPLPLLVTAAELVRADGLVDAVDGRWCDDRTSTRKLLENPRTQVVVLIDSLDEAPENRLVEAIERERRRLGSRLQALVLSSRPAFTPELRDCTRLLLIPLSRHDSTALLDRWSVLEPRAVATLRTRTHEHGLDELLRSPLLTTLCVLAVRHGRGVLTSRSQLFATVYDEILQWWPGHRSPDAPEEPCWPAVAEILRDLAWACLAEQRLDIPREAIEARLRRFDPDQWMSHLQTLERRLGILVPSGGSDHYRFLDRRIMEYLVARKMLRDVNALPIVACCPWAAESARIAFGLLLAEDRAAAQICMHQLLAREANDIPGLVDTELRAVLVAIDVAADEAELGAPVAEQFAHATFHRIIEEYSNWVGDVVARAARRLAGARGPVWARLEPPLVEFLTDPEASREFRRADLVTLITTRDEALRALRHRREEVRLAACDRLMDFCDDPAVQNDLLYLLFDAGEHSGVELSVAAGRVLRQVARGPQGFPGLATLQTIVTWQAQSPSCGAAVALHPGEAAADILVKALELGLHTWATIPPAVFEELEATPAGAEALSMYFPDWRERLVARTRATPAASGVAVRIPATGVSRSRAFEVLTGGPLAPESLARTLELTDNFHQYTDSLDLLDADSRGALLLAVRAKNYPLCVVAQHKLGVLATNDPELAKWVMGWWESFDHKDPHLYHTFPGRALEPLIFAGDQRAIAAYATWLPHSSHVYSGMLTLHNARIDRSILAVPEIRAAAHRAMWGRDGSEVNIPALENLTAAWDRDVAMWRRIEDFVRQEHSRWSAEPRESWYWRQWILDLGEIEIPAAIKAMMVEIFKDVVAAHHGPRVRESSFSHMFLARFIEFAAREQMLMAILPELKAFAGVGCEPCCHQVGVHAACAIDELLTPREHAELSRLWAKQFNHAQHLANISAASLARLIEACPEAWQGALRGLLAANRFGVVFPEHELRIFEGLPVAAQREVVASLLGSAERSTVPWISRRFASHRRVRLADEVRRIAFEARMI